MDGYPGRFPGTAQGAGESVARQTLDDAAAFLRRLIPFPGSETVAPPSLLPMPPLGDAAQLRPGSTQPDSVTAAAMVSEPAAAIVSQAASILDEEMAKGVLAARGVGTTGSYGRSDASNPMLRQMHEFVDNLAALWPSLQGAPIQPLQRLAGYQPTASDADALAEVRPRVTVKPSQRATISMTLRNSENRTVHLVPVATDLLGSWSGRIPSSLLEFTPSEITLEPQEQRDLVVATTVPADAAPGCYSGLLVVRGLNYVRALITIDVT